MVAASEAAAQPGTAAEEQLRVALKLGSSGATRGTIVHGTKLSLRVWLKAVELFARQPEISIHDLGRVCGVSYKTAWRMRTLLRETLSFVLEHESRRAE